MRLVGIKDTSPETDYILAVAIDVPSEPETRAKVVGIRVPDRFAFLAEWAIRAVNNVKDVSINFSRG
jgi:hypothetical protein